MKLWQQFKNVFTSYIYAIFTIIRAQRQDQTMAFLVFDKVGSWANAWQVWIRKFSGFISKLRMGKNIILDLLGSQSYALVFLCFEFYTVGSLANAKKACFNPCDFSLETKGAHQLIILSDLWGTQFGIHVVSLDFEICMAGMCFFL